MNYDGGDRNYDPHIIIPLTQDQDQDDHAYYVI